MTTNFRASTRLRGAFVYVATGGILLSGCASAGPDENAADGSAGVAYGASKEEYQAAFEDVDPITLFTQRQYSEGDLGDAALATYFGAIEEWSAGKISFDVQYASAVAPYHETFQAIVDGRLDVGYSSPSLMPQEFPATTAWNQLGSLGPKSAFPGPAHSYSWVSDGMLSDSQVADEFDAYGLKLLHPFAINGSDLGLLCSKDLVDVDDYRGTTAMVQGEPQRRLVEALGMTAVSLPFTEWYSGFQRGIGDCAATSVTVSYTMGMFDVANHFILDEEELLGSYQAAALAMNKDMWDDLPLVAQQLFYDRLDVMAQASIDTNYAARLVDALDGLGASAGSTVRQLPAEAREAITDDAGLVDLVAGDVNYSSDELESLVDELIQKWSDRFAELGYPDISYADFPAEWTEADLDLAPWASIYFEEVFLSNRPG